MPVVAVLGEVEDDEQRAWPHDKTSDMAAVLMTGRDGRTALLAFTGSAALAGVEPRGPAGAGARPPAAALSAVQDDAAALLVDVAGPVLFVVEGEDLPAWPRGWRLVGWTTAGAGWRPSTPAGDGAAPARDVQS